MTTVHAIPPVIPGQVHVFNNSGATIAAGKLVTLLGWDVGHMLPKIIRADKSPTYAVRYMGVLGTAVGTGAEGFMIVPPALIVDINVGAAAVGDEVYMGDDGDLLYAIPVNTDLRMVVGIVAKAGSSGQVYLLNPSMVKIYGLGTLPA